MSEWHPIETAPKDKAILAYEAIDGKWADPPQPSKTFHYFSVTTWWKGDALNPPRWRDAMYGEFTHWMPLPEPPVIGSGTHVGSEASGPNAQER